MLSIDSIWICNVVDGVTGRIELDALKSRGEETGTPLARGNRLGVSSTNGSEYYKARKVFGLGSKAVVDPGTHRRTTADGSTCIHKGMSGIVVYLLGDHGSQDGDIVRHLLVVGKEIRDVLA